MSRTKASSPESTSKVKAIFCQIFAVSKAVHAKKNGRNTQIRRESAGEKNLEVKSIHRLNTRRNADSLDFTWTISKNKTDSLKFTSKIPWKNEFISPQFHCKVINFPFQSI